MPPDLAIRSVVRGHWHTGMSAPWRQALLRVAIAWVVLIAVCSRAWLAMVEQWWNISTYNHILFVPPILAWLVWIRRHELARLTPRAWMPGLIGVAASLLVWLLGELAGVNLVAQAGAVGALQASVVAPVGPRVAAGLLFPLGYMVFLVPFGDELVPMLQMFTADIVIALTRLSGIPAVVDGVFIDTPAGLFEVAEACSGVKFLIAMIALGVLIAQTCFIRWPRRAVFLAACIAVPIVTNGVRAWGTIYIAQSQGIEFAAGFDHIFYGWIFFAIVVCLILGVAWPFFDRDPEEAGVDGAALARHRAFDWLEGSGRGTRFVLPGTIAIALLFLSWNALSARLDADLPSRLTAPPVEGWEQVRPDMTLDWEPRAQGARLRLLTSYRDGEGHVVDLFVAAYSRQGPGSDAGAQGEGALVPGTEWRWLKSATATGDAQAEYFFALGSVRRLAETSWLIGDTTLASATALTFAAMRDKLLLSPRPVALVILSAEDRPGIPAAQAIARFRQSTGPGNDWMDPLLAGE